MLLAEPRGTPWLTWMVLVAVGMLGGFTFLADWLLGGILIQDVLLKWIGTGAAG